MKTLALVLTLFMATTANATGIIGWYFDGMMTGQPTPLDGNIYMGNVQCWFLDGDNARCVNRPIGENGLHPDFPQPSLGHFDMQRDFVNAANELGFSDENEEFYLYFTGPDAVLNTFTDASSLATMVTDNDVGMRFEWYHPDYDVMFTSAMTGNVSADMVMVDSAAPEPSGFAAWFLGLLALLPMVRR